MVVSMVAVALPPVAQAKTSLRFHASYVGILTTPGGQGAIWTGSGKATVLGKSSLRQIETGNGLANGNCTTFAGTGVLRAKHRSSLKYRYTDTICFGNHITGDGTYTITRGTGKLAGARGHGTLSLSLTNFPDPTARFTWQFTGVLSVPPPVPPVPAATSSPTPS